MKWQKTPDYRIKKRGDTYWARFSRRGQRIQVSLNTRNLNLAKAQVDEIEAKVLAGKLYQRGEQFFKEAWLDFLHDKKLGNRTRVARAKTLYEYGSFGRRYFLPFFGEDRLKNIDSERWIDFLNWLKREHRPMQIFNLRKYFLGFLSWAKAKGHIDEKPFLLNTDNAAEHTVDAKAFTPEELKAMRDASGSGRFHLYILMSQYMGMRPSEITQLKKDRIDLERRVIELKPIDTKTALGRVVPIHDEVMGVLVKAMSWSDSPYLFPNARDGSRPMDKTGFKKAWQTMCERSGVHGRPYDLRHTFITRAILSGVNINLIAKLTGTSVRIIEKHYTHLMPKDLHRALLAVDISNGC